MNRRMEVQLMYDKNYYCDLHDRSDKFQNEGSLDSMYSVKAGYSIDTYNIPNYFEKRKKQNGR